MSDKSPAFQWYPKDYLADEKVALMTLEEEGAYIRLLCYCWLEGSVPTDVSRLACLCRTDPEKMAELITAISPCFHRNGDRYMHPRLDAERRKQQTHSRVRSKAGHKGAKARWDKEQYGIAMDLLMAEDGSSVSSSSSTAFDIGPYSPEFQVFWRTLPKRSGSNPKKVAWEAWNGRRKEGVSEQEMIDAAERYADYCKATGKTGTEYVLRGASFLGPKSEGWKQDWTPPEPKQTVRGTGGSADGAVLPEKFKDKWEPVIEERSVPPSGDSGGNISEVSEKILERAKEAL